MAFTYGGTIGVHNLSTVVNDQRVGWRTTEMFVAEVTRGAEG